jgi:DNA-directed RNA polymerase specialized sigma24 family protein
MKVKYEFNNGDITEVEVSEEIGAMIIDSRREEESAERKHRRHCYSMDAAVYEGLEYGTEDFTEALYDDADERDARVREAFSHLSEIQQKRLLLLAGGMSVREIARREGKNFRTVYDSIEAAKKKFLKFF